MAGEFLEVGDQTCIFNLRDLRPFKFASVGIWSTGVALLVIDGQPRTMTEKDCRWLADLLLQTAERLK